MTPEQRKQFNIEVALEFVVLVALAVSLKKVADPMIGVVLCFVAAAGCFLRAYMRTPEPVDGPGDFKRLLGRMIAPKVANIASAVGMVSIGMWTLQNPGWHQAALVASASIIPAIILILLNGGPLLASLYKLILILRAAFILGATIYLQVQFS